jgi:hypothetical protein
VGVGRKRNLPTSALRSVGSRVFIGLAGFSGQGLAGTVNWLLRARKGRARQEKPQVTHHERCLAKTSVAVHVAEAATLDSHGRSVACRPQYHACQILVLGPGILLGDAGCHNQGKVRGIGHM